MPQSTDALHLILRDSPRSGSTPTRSHPLSPAAGSPHRSGQSPSIFRTETICTWSAAARKIPPVWRIRSPMSWDGIQGQHAYHTVHWTYTCLTPHFPPQCRNGRIVPLPPSPPSPFCQIHPLFLPKYSPTHSRTSLYT